MTTDRERASSVDPAVQAGWGKPRPEVIPRATFAPAAMAFGLTLFFWGLVTSPVVLGVGLLVVLAALIGWVREIRHEA
jgi:hypothetical protein